MMNRIIEQIKNAADIALICHVSPDADTLGSTFALYEELVRLGKKAVVIADEKLPEYLDFICDDYIVYDTCRRYELCICIDCGDDKRIGKRFELVNAAKTSINIDHHYTNTEYADINYVDSHAAATGEIIYRLLREMKLDIPVSVATKLYAAITGDTGGFRYTNTTPDTMRIASNLLEIGVKQWDVNKRIFEEKNIGTVMLLGELSSKLITEEDGKICAVILKNELCDKYGVSIKDMDSIIDIPRSVRGCEIAVSFKQTKERLTKVSLRSNGEADVSKIALKFGGGGHKKAAGLVLELPVLEAYEKILEEAKNVLRG